MKRGYAVVVVAALILAGFAVLPVPCVKAQASQAQVLLPVSWYTAPSNSVLAAEAGDLVVVGEIQNAGSSIIQNVTLSGTAYSSNGTALGVAEGQAFTYETTPGQKAPFFIDFTPSSSTTSNRNWVPSVASVDVTVLSVTDTTTTPYAGLTVPTGYITNVTDNGVFTVVGTILNTGTQTMGYVWVVTTFYNAARTVVSLNYTGYLITPNAPLAPGGATRWVATPADRTALQSSNIAYYSYLIDSEPFVASLTQPTSTPTASPVPSQSPMLSIVVVVVVVVIAVVALMLLRQRQRLPPPPPPSPPPPTS